MNEIKNENIKIESMIYEVSGKTIMLDSDLAKLYKCDTGNLNRARKRNLNRFPNDFAFQISKNEYLSLKCQSGISNIDLRLINRNLPFVYTEQGVAMLSSVLHTEVAINISIKIINAFVSMRKYISSKLIEQEYINNLVLEDHENIKLLQDTFSKLEEKQKVNSIFFEGQIFDAYIFLIDLLSEAKEEIIFIDNYAGKELFKMKKNIKVKVIIISKNIDNEMIKKYQKQYNNLEIKINNSFHDRFIIIDRKVLYHSGASFKDLGEKCFAINLIEDKTLLHDIINIIN